MYYKKQFRMLLLSGVITFSAFQGYSQVGFDNPDPDSSALIDMKAIDKGLLIPRMTSNDRANMMSGGKTPAHALLVFDHEQNMFFVFDTVANPDRWMALNPFQAVSLSGDITTPVIGNVGIGTLNPTQKLEVNGSIKADNNIIANGSISAANATINNSLTASTITASTLSSTGTITAPAFVGNGIIPLGGIILWSGSITSIPAGWALCNGLNGTPNLSGRFIVSSGTYVESTGTYTYSPGNIGGEAKHALSSAELPSHNHASVNGYFLTGTGLQSLASGGAAEGALNGQAVTSTANTGGNQAHENRPPFYALAYIMRIQ